MEKYKKSALSTANCVYFHCTHEGSKKKIAQVATHADIASRLNWNRSTCVCLKNKPFYVCFIFLWLFSFLFLDKQWRYRLNCRRWSWKTTLASMNERATKICIEVMHFYSFAFAVSMIKLWTGARNCAVAWWKWNERERKKKTSQIKRNTQKWNCNSERAK